MDLFQLSPLAGAFDIADLIRLRKSAKSVIYANE